MCVCHGMHAQVEITPKANSREIVAAWMPGTGVEDFVAAAIVR